MKYNLIIQQLKESSDPNVIAFVNDVEHYKRMSHRKLQAKCKQLDDPGVVEELVKDFIPTIVRVAFSHWQKNGSLCFLELISEGVLAAHSTIDRCRKQHQVVKASCVRANIFRQIGELAKPEECPFEFCCFDEEDEQPYKNLNLWGDYSRRNTLNNKNMSNRFSKNAYGISVRECCASCVHKDLTRAVKMRHCMKSDEDVNPLYDCNQWEMDALMKSAGKTQGLVKNKEYLMYLAAVRESEMKAKQEGVHIKPKSIKEIRKDYERLFGPIYNNF